MNIKKAYAATKINGLQKDCSKSGYDTCLEFARDHKERSRLPSDTLSMRSKWNRHWEAGKSSHSRKKLGWNERGGEVGLETTTRSQLAKKSIDSCLKCWFWGLCESRIETQREPTRYYSCRPSEGVMVLLSKCFPVETNRRESRPWNTGLDGGMIGG